MHTTTTAAQRSIFAILSALVQERAGLHYGSGTEDLFLERVSVRSQDVGFESLLDYYYFLKYDASGAEELDRLVDGLVVNETFFFRELEPLRVLVTELVEPLVRRGERPRIWSAACATGEEPLTLAMLLADAGLLDSVDLIASDISTRALDRARNGNHSKRSLRDVPDDGLTARWIRGEDGRPLVAPRLRAAVDWRRINLCDAAAVRAVGRCNVVLCRNALIYFDDATVVRVVDSISSVLVPGGALFVGISESLLRFATSLQCEERKRVFFYRKPE